MAALSATQIAALNAAFASMLAARGFRTGPSASGAVLSFDTQRCNYLSGIANTIFSGAPATPDALAIFATSRDTASGSPIPFAGDNHDEDEESAVMIWAAPNSKLPLWPDNESEDGGEDAFAMPPAVVSGCSLPFVDPALIAIMLGGSLPPTVAAPTTPPIDTQALPLPFPSSDSLRRW
jgi:hypothetical protein